MLQSKSNSGSVAEILPIALPLIVSSGSNAVMLFCDRIFLARFDSVAIQAALPAGVVSFTLCCIFQAVAGYSGTFVAQYHGARNPQSTLRSMAQGLWLSLLMWPLMLLMIPPGLWIIGMSGHGPEVAQAEMLYFWILMLGGIFLSLNATLSGYYSGIGRTQVTMFANVVGCALNIVLDYAFIFGKFGLPRMGIAGAGIATVIGVSIPCCIMGGMLLLRMRRFRVAHRGLLVPDFKLIRRILQFGVPSGLHQLLDVGAFAVFVMLMGRLDPLQFAASNIGFSINHLAFAPLFGIGVAAAVVVGQYQGAGNSEAAYRAGWSAAKIAAVYMGVLGLSFACLPGFYFGVFGADNAVYTLDELLQTGRPLMRILAAWSLFEIINIVIGGALKGAGDTKFVMWYMLIGGWFIWLPGAVLILHLGGGVFAQWIFTAVYCAMLACGFFIRWTAGRWRAIRVIDPNRPIEPPPVPPGSV